MAEYIQNPIQKNDWDPSQGDYVSKSVIEEDSIHFQKIRKQKIIISLLAFLHVLLFLSVLFYF